MVFLLEKLVELKEEKSMLLRKRNEEHDKFHDEKKSFVTHKDPFFNLIMGSSSFVLQLLCLNSSLALGKAKGLGQWNT
jgi:hypothetical protein